MERRTDADYSLERSDRERDNRYYKGFQFVAEMPYNATKLRQGRA